MLRKQSQRLWKGLESSSGTMQKKATNTHSVANFRLNRASNCGDWKTHLLLGVNGTVTHLRVKTTNLERGSEIAAQHKKKNFNSLFCVR
ncbi:hypothetical protein Y032_0074g848 [Ancylostoma ceylanicum]|uniref:Uncharacterized protein n=1 Tax=Ancylostoma ceylanicum TaxID=53326 RepID=A0A016TV83_9BILA|nr:hypothetical protein Y032_0074g848 [Ancylostoma ceylanicum]